MKVLELRAENIKNLKVVEITPDPNTNILTGKNGAGKSAILDAIFMALTGKKLEKPIRDGKDRAEVDIDLGDYKVRKVFTANGDRLEILSPDGAKYPSPQALLDKLLGDLTFDPMAFKHKSPKEQRNILAALVGLNTSDLDAERERLANERTLKNRELKSSEAIFANMDQPEDNLPTNEISMQEAIDGVDKLNIKRKEYDRYLNSQAGYDQKIASAIVEKSTLQDKIQSLYKEVKKLEAEIPKIDKNVQKLTEDKAAMVEPEQVSDTDVNAANGRLKQIEHLNIKIRNAIVYTNAKQRVESQKEQLTEIEGELAQNNQSKKDLIINCKFPIDGLAIDEDSVLYQDQPFSQLSTGQQIRVSTAIAMALNPKLKIILIREGSLLDKEGLKTLIDFAREKDFQLWLEKVSDEKGVGIYIEDGQITDMPKQAVLFESKGC